MGQISERTLLQTGLPEAKYQADLALYHDGQGLSAELLKLALAGIAVVGTLLTVPARPWPDDPAFKALLAGSVIALAACAGTALLQRFFASSALFHHVKALKIASCADPSRDAVLDGEIAVRARQFNRAYALLSATAILLVLGAALLGAAFVRLLFAH